ARGGGGKMRFYRSGSWAPGLMAGLLVLVAGCGGEAGGASEGRKAEVVVGQAAAAPEPAPPPVPARGPERRMAITFDDLPAGPPNVHSNEVQAELTEGILAALAAHEAPAIGFVNEERLEVDGRVDPARVALLERWLEAGHELGNHTYSHPDLHGVLLGEFLDDVVRGEPVTRRLLAARGRELRFFRHPFLHTGLSLETKRAVEAFLEERGYRVAPVTIDNSEWIFGGAYARAYEAGDREEMARLGTAYVDYMERVAAYYEGQSRAILDREIPQTLLVHAYLLNAHHFGELLDRLEARGYRFVPLEEALADPAYDSRDIYTGSGGITWLHRWAITRGLDRSVFAGEPEIPEWLDEPAP
ncbi:MAG TPA: polysaccharide deacetylase family protein, partial [Thermoanaerobaculia bacterium]